MSGMDACFYFAEDERTPMHVGSVAVFDGPAPSYGDVVRLLLGKLPQVPRYRQRVQPAPLRIGRPLWVDDPHFQILYHIRHTAIPKPGNRDQLRNLAGRVLGHRLDLSKPLWELWLVEGLEDGRWAIINKVHHALVDGVAGTDLMELIFDVDPDATHPEPVPWIPRRRTSSTLATVAGVGAGLGTGLASAAQGAIGLTGNLLRPPPLDALAERARVLAAAGRTAARQLLNPGAATLNGPAGPHRRWAWTETTWDDVKQVRAAFGGSMNDVVLAAVTHGFREQLSARGQLGAQTVVRTMVPVSVRAENERGALNNQVSAVLVDLPVGERSPVARLASVRAQMDAHKQTLRAYDPRRATAALDWVPTPALALGMRAVMRSNQIWTQAVTTNVPGPRVPLYVLGRPMTSLYAHVPIGAGLRTSIGIFSYLDTITFGINADFDAVPDVDVLAHGIAGGMRQLVTLAQQETATAAKRRRGGTRRGPVRSVPTGS